jgi:DMSO reductase anchor subunit
MINIVDEQVMADIELIAPTKQKEWGWPAAANFTLGGGGTGFYLFTFLTMIFENPNSALNDPIPYWMMAPVLVALGFLCLIIETGRLLRIPYIFRHLGKAWISKEILAFTLFVPSVILDHFFPHSIFKACAVLSSIFFMVAQGFVLYSSRAIPAWNLSIMPLFFLSSGFASGAGLALLLAASGRLVIEGGLVMLSMICVIWNLIVWLFYLRWSSAIDFRSATEALRRPFMIFSTMVFGHAFPILILLLIQIRPFPEMGAMLDSIFSMVSGLAIITGVTAQKAGMVLSSGFIGKITLKYRQAKVN